MPCKFNAVWATMQGYKGTRCEFQAIRSLWRGEKPQASIERNA